MRLASVREAPRTSLRLAHIKLTENVVARAACVVALDVANLARRPVEEGERRNNVRRNHLVGQIERTHRVPSVGRTVPRPRDHLQQIRAGDVERGSRVLGQ